jgi:hypothetical protein
LAPSPVLFFVERKDERYRLPAPPLSPVGSFPRAFAVRLFLSPFFAGHNGLKLFLEKHIAIPLNGTSVPASFTRHVSFPHIETGSGPDVHFDGPKMDETSEATHEVKGLWLPEKDLTLVRAPLKFIQLARRGRAQT